MWGDREVWGERELMLPHPPIPPTPPTLPACPMLYALCPMPKEILQIITFSLIEKTRVLLIPYVLVWLLAVHLTKLRHE
nr:hypothetical protein [Nostoc sp. ChiSLP01]